MTCVVGVDGGGTKTDVVVVDREGTVVGRSRSGGSNHETIGFAAAGQVLAAAVMEALAGRTDVAASAWALAGLDWPSDEAAMRPVVAGVGLRGPLTVCNDVNAALRVGVANEAGVVVMAGTGMIAAGRSADGRTWRTLAMSSGPGDWGGGPEVVWAAVTGIAQAHMGIGPATELRDVALEATGTTDTATYLEGATRRGRTGLTPHDVWDCSAAGDPVATDIATRTASSVCTAAVTVAGRLGLSGSHDVVLAGRVLDPGHPLLHGMVRTRIARALPSATLRRLGRPPVVGAVLLAADSAGWQLDGFEGAVGRSDGASDTHRWTSDGLTSDSLTSDTDR